MPVKKQCRLCGQTFNDDIEALAHSLVAHPVKEEGRRRRIHKAQDALVKAHRELEARGFTEEQAHVAIGAVARELRKAGLI